MKSALARGGLALACGVLPLLPCKAQLLFQIRESGAVATAETVGSGATVSLDVVAVSIPAEVGVDANLDAFTYRITFPTQQFILLNDVFKTPFDNALSPGGNNGSIPWAGLPLAITFNADAGSPGATPLVADLYRTTATTAGVPVTGPDAVLETFTVHVPTLALGMFANYAIQLDVSEAVDSFGNPHTISDGTPFNLSVNPVPEPAETASVMAIGLLAFVSARRRFQRGSDLR